MSPALGVFPRVVLPQQMAFTLPDDTGALVRLLVWQGLCEAQPGRRRKWGAKGSGPFSTEAAVRPMGTQRTWRPLGRKRCQFRFRDPVPALGIPRPNTKRLEASVPRCPGSGCHQQKALLSVFGPPPRSPDSDALGQPRGGQVSLNPPRGGRDPRGEGTVAGTRACCRGLGSRWQSRRTTSSPPLTTTAKPQRTAQQPLTEKPGTYQERSSTGDMKREPQQDCRSS